MEKTLVVTPTYNEADNIEKFIGQVLAQDPSVEMLIVDDNSPDGTGRLADAWAARDGRVRVIHRAGKLVGLHANQANEQRGAGLLAPANYFLERHFFRGLIEGRYFDGQVAENPARFDVLGQTVQNVEGVARQHSFPKANYVTVVVVLGRLDQNDMEFFGCFQHRSRPLPSACKSVLHLL